MKTKGTTSAAPAAVTAPKQAAPQAQVPPQAQVQAQAQAPQAQADHALKTWIQVFFFLSFSFLFLSDVLVLQTARIPKLEHILVSAGITTLAALKQTPQEKVSELVAKSDLSLNQKKVAISPPPLPP